MDFEEYQQAARETAIYPAKGANIYYPAMGLGGEAGEILNKVKKIMRDKSGIVDRQTQIGLSKELGDVLWYLSNMCDELGLDLEEIAEENILKLQSRQKRGTLQGEGDDR